MGFWEVLTAEHGSRKPAGKMWGLFTGEHEEDRVADGNPNNHATHRRDGSPKIGAQFSECFQRNAEDWRNMWRR